MASFGPSPLGSHLPRFLKHTVRSKLFTCVVQPICEERNVVYDSSHTTIPKERKWKCTVYYDPTLHLHPAPTKRERERERERERARERERERERERARERERENNK